MAGLLRDLGIPILHQMVPDDYATIIAKPIEVLAHQQCELEEEKLGINHAEVTAFVLSKWHLPPEITEAVRFHHHPERAAGQINLIQEAHAIFISPHLLPSCRLAPASPPSSPRCCAWLKMTTIWTKKSC